MSIMKRLCVAQINGEVCGLLESNPIHHQSRLVHFHGFQEGKFNPDQFCRYRLACTEANKCQSIARYGRACND